MSSIGIVPFKSPAPKPKKRKKVDAPMKPKKLTPSTSNTSLVGTKKVSSMKAQNSAMVVSTPIAKSSSTTGERKRDRPASETSAPTIDSKKIALSSDEMSTAMFLTALASPKPATKTKRNQTNGSVSVTSQTPAPVSQLKAVAAVTPKDVPVASKKAKAIVKSTPKTKLSGDPGRSKIVQTPTANKKVSNSNHKSKTKSSTSLHVSAVPQQQQPTREEILYERISEQYKQLRVYLKSITDRSMAFIHSRNLRGPVPSALAGAVKKDSEHVSAYAKLLAEHRAAHDYLQRRLLNSAETTLRFLLESRITAEEARSELKQSIKRFEEILCDTLHHQERERLAVVAQHYGSPSNFARKRGLRDDDSNHRLQTIKDHSDYPCKGAFDRVEDICLAISRQPGRPRSALAALR